jgi:hypothetical protein
MIEFPPRLGQMVTGRRIGAEMWVVCEDRGFPCFAMMEVEI